MNSTQSRILMADVETTGLYPERGDRIVEIGLVEYVDRRPTGNHFHVYINPERDMPAEAFAVHKLSSEFLQDKPVFAEIADKLVDFIKGAELVIHNAPFDVGFFNAEFARVGMLPIDAHVTAIGDTLAYSKRLGEAKRHSLDALCDRYGISRAHRVQHGALLDSGLLGEVYINLTRGQEALGMFFAENGGDEAQEEVRPVDSTGMIVIRASDDELDEHEAYMAKMAKDNGGKNVWQPEPSRRTPRP